MTKTGIKKIFGYTISYDPILNDNHTDKILEEIESLFYDVQKKKKGIIGKISETIKKYPDVLQFKNYLATAYTLEGNKEKAYEINLWIFSEHPDYIFARLGIAIHYLEQKQFDKMREILGYTVELKDMYPDRKIFHSSEFLCFYKTAALYFLAIDDIAAAEERYDKMIALDANHPDTSFISLEIAKYRIETNIKKMKEDNKSRRTPELKSRDIIKTIEKPVFHNEIVDELYKYGVDIDHNLIRIILSLPHDNLIKDLEAVVMDSIYRYEYFSENYDELDEDELFFPVHAIFILTELRAESSLDCILELLRQNDDCFHFWFGDMSADFFWEAIYRTGRDNLEKLYSFMQEPNLNAFSKCFVPETVSQLALHETTRRQEVVEWFRKILNFYIENNSNNDIVDTDLNGLIVSYILDFRGKELLPEIKKIYDLELASTLICGYYEDVEKEMLSAPKISDKQDVLDIFERYEETFEKWYNDDDDDDDYDDGEDYEDDNEFDEYEEIEEDKGSSNKSFDRDNEAVGTIKKEKEPGRNDPCPCGSGKKYKKCCL